MCILQTAVEQDRSPPTPQYPQNGTMYSAGSSVGPSMPNGNIYAHDYGSASGSGNPASYIGSSTAVPGSYSNTRPSPANISIPSTSNINGIMYGAASGAASASSGNFPFPALNHTPSSGEGPTPPMAGMLSDPRDISRGGDDALDGKKGEAAKLVRCGFFYITLRYKH